MASNLEVTSQKFKKIGIGCIIVVVLIVVGGIIVRIFKKEESLPPLYPFTATAAFGTLTPLSFEALSLDPASKAEITLDTTNGKLPILPKIGNVFKTKTPHQSLTSQDTAVSIAKQLGFTGDFQASSETTLEWHDGVRTLDIDKLYGTVNITSDFKTLYANLAGAEFSPDINSYVTTTRSILQNVGLTLGTKNSAIYIKSNPDGTLTKVSSASEANLARVDFFQTEEPVFLNIPAGSNDKQKALYEKYRIYSDVLYDNPNEGLSYAIVGEGGGTREVYALRYVNWTIASSSTYQFVGTDTAWEAIQAGKGYLRSLVETGGDPFQAYTPKNVNQLLVTDVRIAYYSVPTYIEYLQPIYIFSGTAVLANTNEKADFVIYYPAVKY